MAVWLPHTIESGPTGASSRLLLAHGAGAAMDSPFMELFASMLSARGIAVTRFEFAYMAARRNGGSRKPPPRADRLTDEYKAAVAHVAADMTARQRLFIGGKSMGGRVASMIAGDLFANRNIAGLVCLGYPFHPPNKPTELRTAHLETLTCPTLIVQGDRDPFGGRGEVEAMVLSPAIGIHWASDGDHDLAPRGASGFTRKGNLQSAADAVAAFMGAG